VSAMDESWFKKTKWPWDTVAALSDVRIDPDWRTDTMAATHVWYCRDMTADRDNCQLRGMTQAIEPESETDTGTETYYFWPKESPPDEDKFPDGTPLTLPANAMSDDTVGWCRLTPG